ncbi:MAG: hypothetical protein KF898_07155 [Parachlamydiales bacterium]|nr:hypothetical protein [Verrucomicrobiota bacterium]MBX3719408.1 hypothetical protein [Candidatus Acheromyda pituitae]
MGQWRILRLASVTLAFFHAACASLSVEAAEPENILAAEEADWQDELDQIDKETHQLKDLKNRYEASAARHDNNAMRWQFQQNMKQEARRAYQQAELDREMQKQIQARIDYLDARKAEILKEHPEANAVQKSS